ncbi:MAG: type IV secretion system protein VirB8, partial [Burkholderiaceae bacterium]|nr:type IV secretion system protein VirB8 [Burkholderiaceae bacterium]
MSALLMPGRAAALPDLIDQGNNSHGDAETANSISANAAWEIDRALILECSERRAWWVACAGMLIGLTGIAA